ncbi:MAG TPA: hypothetical protein VL443_24360 [Cyclobacteriaceae bacterium]|jgi:hypothetical protein|nr:hypothetical protein [Cyclobacteriaceae bacterium]
MGIHRKFSGTITRAAATASGSESITGIGGKPIMVIFYAMSDSNSSINSKGFDDGSIATCIFCNVITGLINLLGGTSNFANVAESQTKSIDVENTTPNGHNANISSMDNDGFTLNWTKIGSGLALTVKYIAIL